MTTEYHFYISMTTEYSLHISVTIEYSLYIYMATKYSLYTSMATKYSLFIISMATVYIFCTFVSLRPYVYKLPKAYCLSKKEYTKNYKRLHKVGKKERKERKVIEKKRRTFNSLVVCPCSVSVEMREDVLLQPLR